MYTIEDIHKALRCVSDGESGSAAARASGASDQVVRKWVKQFKVHQNSFLTDDEILERISLYAERSLKAKLGESVDKFKDHPIEKAKSQFKPQVASEPDTDDDEPPITALTTPGLKKEPDRKPIKSALSVEDQARLSQSIRLTLGDRAMNDVNNAVVALIAGTAERLKHVTNSEDAIKMVSSAIGLKQLLDVLEAPPMAMNWNDVHKIISVIREANEIQTIRKDDEQKRMNTPTQVNVTILSQKPPKATKTVDAEIIAQ